MKTDRPLSDPDRVLLLLYLLTEGLPPFARHENGQVQVISLMFDWDEERVKATLSHLAEQGLAAPTNPLNAEFVGDEDG